MNSLKRNKKPSSNNNNLSVAKSVIKSLTHAYYMLYNMITLNTAYQLHHKLIRPELLLGAGLRK